MLLTDDFVLNVLVFALNSPVITFDYMLAGMTCPYGFCKLCILLMNGLAFMFLICLFPPYAALGFSEF